MISLKLERVLNQYPAEALPEMAETPAPRLISCDVALVRALPGMTMVVELSTLDTRFTATSSSFLERGAIEYVAVDYPFSKPSMVRHASQVRRMRATPSEAVHAFIDEEIQPDMFIFRTPAQLDPSMYITPSILIASVIPIARILIPISMSQPLYRRFVETCAGESGMAMTELSDGVLLSPIGGR